MSLKRSVLSLSLFVLFGASQSFATSVTFPSTNITLSLGNIDLRSYDGSGFNTIGKSLPVIPTDFLQLSSFTGAPNGNNLSMFFLSSVADYRNQDEFGLMNDSGNFVSSVKGSSALGTEADYAQGANENLHFAFKSPESTFFTDPTQNADGQVHMLFVQATTNALLTIPNADLQGDSETFNLLAGDYICFNEDMLKTSSLNGANGWDADYNDFLVVIRANQAAVPEPGTMLLLGAGSLVAAMRRRRMTA